MGSSSSKTTFLWQKKKKKKSSLNNAWTELKGALPNKKRKKNSKLSLKPVKRGRHSQRKFSLATDRKEAKGLKGLSLGNMRTERRRTSSPGRRDGDGLANIRQQIKRTFSFSL